MALTFKVATQVCFVFSCDTPAHDNAHRYTKFGSTQSSSQDDIARIWNSPLIITKRAIQLACYSSLKRIDVSSHRLQRFTAKSSTVHKICSWYLIFVHLKPHCDFDLEGSNPIFMLDAVSLTHNTDNALQCKVWLQMVKLFRRYHPGKAKNKFPDMQKDRKGYSSVQPFPPPTSLRGAGGGGVSILYWNKSQAL